MLAACRGRRGRYVDLKKLLMNLRSVILVLEGPRWWSRSDVCTRGTPAVHKMSVQIFYLSVKIQERCPIGTESEILNKKTNIILLIEREKLKLLVEKKGERI